jgi:predicted acetyltransferase
MKAATAELIVPRKKYLDSCVEAGMEFRDLRIRVLGLYDPEETSAEEWKRAVLEKYSAVRKDAGLPEGRVPASTFWLVEEGEFVGIGNLRHRLTESLRRLGGHIGYAVRPTKWNRGYGTLLLKLLLKEAATQGIDEVLLTCDAANAASFRVMEKNGGVLIDAFEDVVEGRRRTTRRYKIHVGPEFANGDFEADLKPILKSI